MLAPTELSLFNGKMLEWNLYFIIYSIIVKSTINMY